MGHLQKVEADLRAMLTGGTPFDEIIKWVQDAVLASYQNGLAAKRPGSPRREVAARRGAKPPAPTKNCVWCGVPGKFAKGMCEQCWLERSLH